EGGITAEAWQSPWSSAAAYALGQSNALLTDHTEYLALSPDAASRQRLWREFLMDDDPLEEEVRRGDWALGDALVFAAACFTSLGVRPRGRVAVPRSTLKAGRPEFPCNRPEPEGLCTASPFSPIFPH